MATDNANTPAKKDSVAVMLEANWKTIKNVLPRHLTPERMARIAYTAIVQSPALRDCNPVSLANAVITASQLGLEIGGPIGMAYLVPYKKEATLIIGYKGFQDLAYRSGMVSNFSAHPVYEHDHFEYCYGLTPKLEHRPSDGKRGALKYAYAVCHFKGGGYDFEVVTPEDISVTKRLSAGARSGSKDCPWNNPDQEWTMWVKTAIRRLAKRIPQSPDMQLAAAIDERAEAGLGQGLTHIIDVEPASDPTTGMNDALKGQGKGKPKPAPEMLECPDKGGEPVKSAGCSKCAKRTGCPAWSDIDKDAKDAS